MAAITAAMVSELRAQTGAGMMQCKAALTEANGDLNEAKVILRKKLGDKAASRGATRVAAEGLTFAHISDSKTVGVLIELNCETDFVARNPEFKKLGAALLEKIAAYAPGTVPTSLEAFLADSHEGTTVEAFINDAAGPVGEKVALGRFERFGAPAGNVVASYVHNPGGSGDDGGKIGVLVEVTGAGDAGAQLGRELALHIASTNPQYLTEESVEPDIIDKEKEIALAQAQNDPKMAGKPEKVLESLVNGRVRKFLEETVLMNQAYIRDPAKRISALVSETPGADVVRFVRFRVGENVPDQAEGAEA